MDFNELEDSSELRKRLLKSILSIMMIEDKTIIIVMLNLSQRISTKEYSSVKEMKKINSRKQKLSVNFIE